VLEGRKVRSVLNIIVRYGARNKLIVRRVQVAWYFRYAELEVYISTTTKEGTLNSKDTLT